MNRVGQDGMWDEEDGFYYDVLRLPDGTRDAAQGALDGGSAAAVRDHGHRALAARARAEAGGAAFAERVRRMPELLQSIHPTGPGHSAMATAGSWRS